LIASVRYAVTRKPSPPSCFATATTHRPCPPSAR
jgi:hypothetical protein